MIDKLTTKDLIRELEEKREGFDKFLLGVIGILQKMAKENSLQFEVDISELPKALEDAKKEGAMYEEKDVLEIIKSFEQRRRKLIRKRKQKIQEIIDKREGDHRDANGQRIALGVLSDIEELFGDE